jgi:hypothetical protein
MAPERVETGESVGLPPLSLTRCCQRPRRPLFRGDGLCERDCGSDVGLHPSGERDNVEVIDYEEHDSHAL